MEFLTVVANLSVGMDKDAWTLLADVVQLMKCDEEEIVVLSHVARYKLTGDTRHLDSIPLPKTNRWSGKLKDYIPRKWVESKRIPNGEIFIELSESAIWSCKGICKITESINSGTSIKEKEVLLRYEKACEGEHKASHQWINNNHSIFYYDCILNPVWKNMEITALCDGIVYFSEEKRPIKHCYSGYVYETYLGAYIVSIFDDYDSFKSWMDNR